VILFTTMPTERPLYRRDALNAIGYPAGWPLTLSYRGKWVHDDLWKACSNKRLVDQIALFVLCCADDEEGEFKDFIALRFGTIVDSEAPKNRTDDAVMTVHLSLLQRPSAQAITRLSTILRARPRVLPRPAKRRPYYAGFAATFGIPADLQMPGQEAEWH